MSISHKIPPSYTMEVASLVLPGSAVESFPAEELFFLILIMVFC